MIQIYDLKTNGMRKLLGTDMEIPIFSWKLSASESNVRQESYQIQVAGDAAFTEIVWNSGTVSSDRSLGIKYEGKALEAAKRYFWKVCIEANGQKLESPDAWFETGLMGTDSSVWNGAKWIGSPEKTQNTDGVTAYSISAEFKTSDRAGIVIAARNKDNYVLVETDVKAQTVKIYEYCDNAWDGSRESGVTPAVTVRGKKEGYRIPNDAEVFADRWNHLCIEVSGTAMTIALNDIIVLDRLADIIPSDPPNQPRKAFMMLTGIRQLGNRAFYNKIEIRNTETGSIYQSDDFTSDTGILSALGRVENGQLVVENEFHLVNAVPTVYVRKAFHMEKKLKKARLYASAMGVYNVYLNGRKVNSSFFNPGFTDYRKRIHYQTYDVTDMIGQGENTIGAAVAKGYYSGYVGYSVFPMVYGEQNTFIALLVITYEDNTQDIIVTDDTWQFTDKGIVVAADYQQGEYQDARLAVDWNDMEDRRFGTCKAYEWPSEAVPTNGILEGEKFELSAQEGPSAEVERILVPADNPVENPAGHFVYDFGQNMVGTVRLRLRAKRGTSIKLRYGEMSYKNGELYLANLRSAANTDVYTFRGDEAGEEFLPAFTFHGFRYMEISGNGYELTKKELQEMVLSIEGLVLTNVTEMTGSFTCSNESINRLQKNIEWGQRGNSLLVFTDCPQRNERMGWTGDAQVFAATAAYNMDIQAFMNKWLQDVADGQLMYNRDGAVPDTAPLGGDNRRGGGCAGWGDAGVIVPWEMYLAYGDQQVLERFYEMMKKWVEYQSRAERQNCGMRTLAGREVPEQSDLSSEAYIQIQQSRGDHLTFDESTPFILSATAYAAYAAKLMTRTAELLGKEEDAARYRERYEKVKNAFQEAWVKEDGSLGYWGEMSKSGRDIHGNVINQTYYSNEEGNPNHPSQTAYALAIDFGLIPESGLPRASECLKQAIEERDGRLSVGFLGISHLAPALTKAGLTDMAYLLLEQDENPSWLYSVKNGATTIWERWNSYIAETGEFGDVNMNSFNHYAYGAIGEWMYHTILGINTSERPGETGYKRIILKPTAGGSLTFAEGSYESAYGRITSSWELRDGSFYYKCSIPANTTAELYLPGETAARELGSGTYHFAVEYKASGK